MPAPARPYVRASLGPVNASGLAERCRSVAEACVRQGALGALLFIEGGKPHHVAVRRAMRAMVTAGAPGNFRMALVAATPEDYRTCKYIEAVAQRCALQAKAFFDERDAVSWMHKAGDAPIRAAQSSTPQGPRG
jgi:hypothetical protein